MNLRTFRKAALSLVEEGKKIIYLPANGNYSVKLMAKGSGTLSVSINEYSYSVGNNVRIVCYNDIAFEKGCIYGYRAGVPFR